MKGSAFSSKAQKGGNYRKREGWSYHPTKGFRKHRKPPQHIWFEKLLPNGGQSVLA